MARRCVKIGELDTVSIYLAYVEVFFYFFYVRWGDVVGGAVDAVGCFWRCVVEGFPEGAGN